MDTPGQIEVFTWSASGAIITDMLASTFPTVVLYAVDTPRTQSPVTFMSNMVYACSIMYKTRLPFTVVMNKSDVVPADFAMAWMADLDAFLAALDAEEGKPDSGYIHSLTRSLALSLDEFYTSLRAVSFSAATGAGIPELFAALQDAVAEYVEEYVPQLLKAVEDRNAAADVAAATGAGAAAAEVAAAESAGAAPTAAAAEPAAASGGGGTD